MSRWRKFKRWMAVRVPSLGQAKWRTYEEVTRYLLNQFAYEFGLGLVEGKQLVRGKRSQTEWEIDAKGVRIDGVGFVLVECRRWVRSRQSQDDIAALAYKISDTGAEGGISVSPLGLQVGARRVAAAEKIVEVHLDADSTHSEFMLSFLGALMIGRADLVGVKDGIAVEVRVDGRVVRRIEGR